MATSPSSPSGNRGNRGNKGPGRFTPKTSNDDVLRRSGNAKDGAKDNQKDARDAGPAYASSGRYTKPAERTQVAAAMPTKPWVPWVMFALLILGGLLIVLNYVDVLPNSPSNWYLLGGIVAITGGFVAATQLR